MRVRLVKIAGADLRRFEFDYDLTWFCFFLNADETIYGRYGGRDAADPEGRISMKGLRYAMSRALEAHKAPPRAAPLAGAPVTAENFAAARKHSGCIHCHNVNEFRRADERAAGKWDRESVWVYPLPENVGFALDVDGGDLVKSVAPGSAAATAGLKPGDRVARLNGFPIASFADAQYALHKAPKKGAIEIAWVRERQELNGKLALAEGWRKTNLTWRPSMLDILPAIPLSGDDLTAAEKKALGLDPKYAALRQEPKVQEALAAAGLKGGDVVFGFDGTPVEGNVGKLLGHVRRNYLVGDTLTLNVIRAGKRVEVKFTLK